MEIIITSCLALTAILVGYCAVCCYLRQEKLSAFWRQARVLNRNRLAYLLAGVVFSTVMIVLFQTTYRLGMLQQLKLLALVLVILPIAAVDYRQHKMPNQFLIAGLVLRVILFGAEYAVDSRSALTTLKDCAIGAVVYGAFFLLLLLVFKNSVGMGDVKLFALMGFYQGLWGAFSSVFFSLLVTFVLSVFLLITKKKKRNDVIAFGPSILLGTVISICLSGM